MDRLIGVFGLLIFIGISYLLSTDRKRVSWKLVAWGLGLQFVFAIIILPDSFFNVWIKSLFGLQMAPGAWFFDQLNEFIKIVLEFTKEGSYFLIRSNSLEAVGESFENFLFGVLPTILFFSSVMAILYHLGVIQLIVSVIAKGMSKTMGTSGAESLSAAANIFVGQTEAPLVIKPYVEKMTKSELLAVMTGGMATVAGGIMAAYVAMLSDVMPDIAGHLIAASVMSAPAALVCAKILIPETEAPLTAGNSKLDVPKTSANVIDAAANGALDGLQLAMNVAAMLLVFISLIALINAPIQWLGGVIGVDLSMQKILGYLMAPLAFIMGVPWKDAADIGAIIGIKTVINEFVAFSDMAAKVKTPEFIAGMGLSYKSVVITTYALCGFSNFSSIAIQIGGIGAIAPSRKTDLARLGLKALLAGSFACFMTAAIAGILTPSDAKSNLMTQKDPGSQNAGPLVLKQSFREMKVSLLSFTRDDIREGIWRSSKGKSVAWQNGRFYSIAENPVTKNKVLKLYFGIKAMAEVEGDELNDFAQVELKSVPVQIEIIENHVKKVVNFKDIKKGDNLKVNGKLTKFQASPAVLFALEEGSITNVPTVAAKK